MKLGLSFKGGILGAAAAALVAAGVALSPGLAKAGQDTMVIAIGALPQGIDLDKIPSSYRKSVDKSIELNHEKWADHFKLEENKLKLTKDGYAFSDSITIDLMI